MINKENASGIQKGLRTHNQDNSITPQNFNVIRMKPKMLVKL